MSTVLDEDGPGVTAGLSSSPETLYRFRDAGGALLYVGITRNPWARFAHHAKTKPWWREMATIQVEHYPDRESVQIAEAEAIRAEGPRYNVIMYEAARSARDDRERTRELPSGGLSDYWTSADIAWYLY
jgi:hypothetical protein